MELKLFGEDVPTVRRWMVALADRGFDDPEAMIERGLRRVVLRAPGVRDSYPHLASRLRDIADTWPAVWLGYAGWVLEEWAPLSRAERDAAASARWTALRARIGGGR